MTQPKKKRKTWTGVKTTKPGGPGMSVRKRSSPWLNPRVKTNPAGAFRGRPIYKKTEKQLGAVRPTPTGSLKGPVVGRKKTAAKLPVRRGKSR